MRLAGYACPSPVARAAWGAWRQDPTAVVVFLSTEHACAATAGAGARRLGFFSTQPPGPPGVPSPLAADQARVAGAGGGRGPGTDSGERRRVGRVGNDPHA